MPVLGLVSAGIGAYQAIAGGIKKHKAERDLERQANSYQPNAGILDYYNKALAKYNPNPYQSSAYQQQNNQIQRNLATGINAAQNRRSGLMAIAGATQQANDASARAVGSAEQQQRANLGMLGQAAHAKMGEDNRKFDMLYNLKAMKAGQAATMENSGIRNIYSGIGTYLTAKDNENNGGSSYTPTASRIASMPRNSYNPSLLSYNQ